MKEMKSFEFVRTAPHVTDQYANNRIEADHGRLKARLGPIRGLKRLASAHDLNGTVALADRSVVGRLEL